MRIDVKETMENKTTSKKSERMYIKKPYCDATEAQARRSLLQDFKGKLNKMAINFRMDIAENGKTMPGLTNIAYAQLDELLRELNECIDGLHTNELNNITYGDGTEGYYQPKMR